MTNTVNKILDASGNKLPILEEYLCSSRTNTVILTDYWAMETFRSIPRAKEVLQILAKYHKQVVVLKSSTVISRLRPRSHGLFNRMMDYEQTRAFAEFSKAFVTSSPGVDEHIRGQQIRTDHFFNDLARAAVTMREAMIKMASQIHPSDLKGLRTGEQATPDFGRRNFNTVRFMGEALHKKISGNSKIPAFEDILFSVPYRFSLCSYCLFLLRAADGTLQSAKTRNDHTDMTYAAYATFFDGLISNDKALVGVYSISAAWIDTVLRKMETTIA